MGAGRWELEDRGWRVMGEGGGRKAGGGYEGCGGRRWVEGCGGRWKVWVGGWWGRVGD